MTDKLDHLIESYASWTISFDKNMPIDTISIVGVGFNIVNRANSGATVDLFLADCEHRIIDISPDRFLIYSSNARFPIYFRTIDNIVMLSNVVYNLFSEGEMVSIDPFVLCQQLSGNYSNDNFFSQIQLLEYNSKYALDSGNACYICSTLKFIENVSTEDCIAQLLLECESTFSSGKNISLLLSGGYDSRLNLAISLEMVKKYGNNITLWHEYKNEEEFALSKNIADSIGIRLNVKDRDAFSGSVNQVIFNASYIRNSGPIYRTNIPRWINYLHYIKMTDGDSIIFGHGAEGHKGKYYNQIDSLEDVAKTFGVNTVVVECIGKALGLAVSNDSQIFFFDKLKKHSRFFTNFTGKVDFIHYHSYVANGYGRRSHAMSQYFNIPFPFLNGIFLSLVFSLPKKHKEGFQLVVDTIRKLHPEFLDFPFVSANIKSLKANSLRKKVLHSLGLKWLRKIKTKYFYKNNIGNNLPTSQITVLNECNYLPKSEITLALKKVLNMCESSPLPYIRYEHALQLYLFFKLCEEEKNVIFVSK